ncbi:MAG: choice-of-anchor J domain-containing protein [Candidatus Amulumruptor caecigallinarius]|nr:choice-of-anchor J domain-containing protein [Candidatus Amulumruptor caecigallinarius]
MKKAIPILSSVAVVLALATPSIATSQLARKNSSVPAKNMAEQRVSANEKSKRSFNILQKRKSNARKGLKRAGAGTIVSTGKFGAPMHEGSVEIPEINGSVIFSSAFTEDDNNIGLYRVNSADTEFLIKGPNANYGGVCVDGIYYASEMIDLGFLQFGSCTAYNVETGDVAGLIDITSQKEAHAVGGETYDPSTGNVYGITYNSTGNGLQLTKLDYTPTQVTATKIADLQGNWNSIACDAQGQLYAIAYSGQTTGQNFTVTASYLYKIDKTTGALTMVGETGQIPQYLSSAAIDAKTGKMYWNVCPPDGSSLLCEVNLTTGVATQLLKYTNDEEIMGMYVPFKAEGKAPGEITALQASFPEGSMKGTISFSAPTTLFDGSAGSGNLNYKILADGNEVAAGTTTFGATVNAEVTMDEAREYTFTVFVSNSQGESPKARVTVFVGKGTPKAPEATLTFENKKMTLNWTPVTESVNGGYMNPAAVTYDVTRYPGAVKVGSALALTTFSELIDVPAAMTEFYYEVVAVADGVASTPAKSNVITLGSIVPPYSNSFDTQASIDGFTIIDSNRDGISWTWQNGAMRCQYNSNKDMDDWLISPPMLLEAGNTYYVSFVASSNSPNFPEKVEAKFGTSPTAGSMTQALVDPTTVASASGQELGNFITPQSAGVYYIGIHGISSANQFYLFIDDFKVSAAKSMSVPGDCTDIEIIPDANGGLSAKVTFNTPKVDLAGNQLNELTKIVVSRGEEVIKTFENPAVGARLEFDDIVSVGGTQEYTFQAYNESGAGSVVIKSAFVGVDKPSAPGNVKIVETNVPGEVTITWDAVTTGFNGMSINPDLVKYAILSTDDEGHMGEVLFDNITDTSFTFQAVPAGEQAFVQFMVMAKTNGGATSSFTELIPAGTPYNGIVESFSNTTLTYPVNIWYPNVYNRGDWGLYDDEYLGVASQDGDNGFAAFYGEDENSTAALSTLRINLAGMETPGVSFYTYNIAEDDANEIQVLVKEQGSSEWKSVGKRIVVNQLSDMEGWHLATVSLAEYKDKVVQVSLQAFTKQYLYTMIDVLKIGNLSAQDLSATAISAPSQVNAGDEFNVVVTVANDGMEASSDAAVVELYEDEKMVESKPVMSLTPGSKVDVTFNRSMGEIAEKPLDYYAKVVYALDENQDNNITKNISVAPKFSSLPKVTDLSAVSEDNGIMLTWSEPDMSNVSEPKFVDFEDATAWNFNYDGWTFIDKDGAPLGTPQGVTMPGITPNETTGSFFIFDVPESGGNNTFAAHSGDIFLAALFRYDDGTVDDWAISPELDGTQQTISFWAKSYDSKFPEKIEMLYSIGGKETEDFVKVSEQKPVSGTWTELKFDVPEGARYFAIRSCATGSFMLMLDDFSFNAAVDTENLSILGYDVYRDGVKITENPVEETEYLDTNAPEGKHSYVVVAVYNSGISAPSNVAKAETSEVLGLDSDALIIESGKGFIKVSGAHTLNVVAADGHSMFCGNVDGTVEVSAPAGIYVVVTDKRTEKVIVR